MCSGQQAWVDWEAENWVYRAARATHAAPTSVYCIFARRLRTTTVRNRKQTYVPFTPEATYTYATLRLVYAILRVGTPIAYAVGTRCPCTWYAIVRQPMHKIRRDYADPARSNKFFMSRQPNFGVLGTPHNATLRRPGVKAPVRLKLRFATRAWLCSCIRSTSRHWHDWLHCLIWL